MSFNIKKDHGSGTLKSLWRLDTPPLTVKRVLKAIRECKRAIAAVQYKQWPEDMIIEEEMYLKIELGDWEAQLSELERGM